MTALVYCVPLIIGSMLPALEQEEGFSITSEQADLLAQKIWNNECNGSTEGLTTWRQGETFASLGIGHFIWYPKDQKGPFDETFPALLLFIQKSGHPIPEFLTKCRGCPWTTKKSFYDALQSKEMTSLRNFLVETKELQALFIVKRLEKSFPLLIFSAPEKERTKIKEVLYYLARNERGLYALVDYMNFKGLGISSTERYNGQGWGLLQVLSRMKYPLGEDPVTDFANSAKELLQERVQNAPQEQQENEKKWLKGWLNRVDTYIS